MICIVLSETFLFAQAIPCGKLVEYIEKNHQKKDVAKIATGSLLKNATWYEQKKNGYVVVYLKADANSAVAQIYCNINRRRWESFKIDAYKPDQYIPSFEKYIKRNPCDCTS